MKTVRELLKLPSFEERYEYLCFGKEVGVTTFGYDRYLNQALYKSRRWVRTRDSILLRDEGCDLGHPDYPIGGRIIVHHLNPIEIDDIIKCRSNIFDHENLICVSELTHQAIHYGNKKPPIMAFVERTPNDMAPWLQKG